MASPPPSSSSNRVRTPSWISLDVSNDDDETRQPVSSPSSREGKMMMTPRRRCSSTTARAAAAVTPNTPPPQSNSRKKTNTNNNNNNSGSGSMKRCPPSPSNKLVKVTPSSSTSTLWEQRKVSRRGLRNSSSAVPRESFLVGLCRQKEWKTALTRLQEYPEEAEPIQLMQPLVMGQEYEDDECSPFPPLNLDLNNYNNRPLQQAVLYNETPLDVLCSFGQFDDDDDSTIVLLLEELLKTCPQQAMISHQETGHTALRSLLRNHTCTATALRLLLQGMKKTKKEEEVQQQQQQQQLPQQQLSFQELCTLPDRDGLRPIDHIVLAFHQRHQDVATATTAATAASSSPLEILKVFVEEGGFGKNSGLVLDSSAVQQVVSPLIRLLSLGNGNGSYSSPGIINRPSPSSPQRSSCLSSPSSSSPTTQAQTTSSYPPALAAAAAHDGRSSNMMVVDPSSSKSKDQHQLQQIVEATKFFIHQFPTLLDQTSLTTQCTPLHVALRNYGNCNSLIQCLLLQVQQQQQSKQQEIGKEETTTTTNNNNKENGDNDQTLTISPLILRSLQQENQFGDLPLHVASSVGVPVPILRLVLEGTLQATKTKYYTSSSVASIPSSSIDSSSSFIKDDSNKAYDSHRHLNLCWTVNHAGYTPIDLEWIRHMEDGKGLFMARSFYPLEAGGIKKTFWKQDEFYRVLLQQAVQQATMDVRARAGGSTTTIGTNQQTPSHLLTTTTTTTRALNHHPTNSGNLQGLPNPTFSSERQHRPIAAATATAITTTTTTTTTMPIPTTGSAATTVGTTTRRGRTNRAGQQTPPQQQQRGARFHHHHHHQTMPTTTTTSPAPQPSEQPTWELLLHRIFLITQTAATGHVPKTQTELVHGLLHSACKLCFPIAPSLPLPLLELILFMYPEQLLQPYSTVKNTSNNTAEDEDEEDAEAANKNTHNVALGRSSTALATGSCRCNQGNLPLHFAVQPPQQYPVSIQCPSATVFARTYPTAANTLTNEDSEATIESNEQHTSKEWEAWCKQLLEHGPNASSSTNDAGQLPLHKALEYQCCTATTSSGCQPSSKTRVTNIHKENTKRTNCQKQQKRTSTHKRRRRLLSHEEHARLHVIQALVDSFPHSVNTVDPVSHLMPFQMAAASPYMPLDAVFYLLRRSPDAVLAS